MTKKRIPDCLITGLALVILILSGIGIMSLVVYVVFNYGYNDNMNSTVTINNTPSNSTDANNIIMFMNTLSSLLFSMGFLVSYIP
jgi:hypothetical protein